jgi:hypothetical protein
LSTAPAETLEEAIRQSGEGWLIDWFSPPERAMPHIRRTLEAVDREAKKRLGTNAPDLSERALIKEFNRSPVQVRGFFQALGGTGTPDLLLMAWRIIQGMYVKQIQLSYSRKEEFHVTVVLESPYGDPEESYESNNIHDFALFRHIGTMEISGQPVFDGFYALNLTNTD